MKNEKINEVVVNNPYLLKFEVVKDEDKLVRLVKNFWTDGYYVTVKIRVRQNESGQLKYDLVVVQPTKSIKDKKITLKLVERKNVTINNLAKVEQVEKYANKNIEIYKELIKNRKNVVEQTEQVNQQVTEPEQMVAE